MAVASLYAFASKVPQYSEDVNLMHDCMRIVQPTFNRGRGASAFFFS